MVVYLRDSRSLWQINEYLWCYVQGLNKSLSVTSNSVVCVYIQFLSHFSLSASREENIFISFLFFGWQGTEIAQSLFMSSMARNWASSALQALQHGNLLVMDNSKHVYPPKWMCTWLEELQLFGNNLFKIYTHTNHSYSISGVIFLWYYRQLTKSDSPVVTFHVSKKLYM